MNFIGSRYWALLLLMTNLMLFSCNPDNTMADEAIGISKNPVKDYIRKIPGENDTIPEAVAQKGEVLIAYSDCYTCHSMEKRAKGPAFKDIAERYPIQEPYINMLAHRIIAGGSGAWGSPVMLPHPQLDHDDAKIMVSYILSLKKD